MNIKEVRSAWYKERNIIPNGSCPMRVSAATPNIIKVTFQMLRPYFDMLDKEEVTEVTFDGYLWPAGPRQWPCRFVVISKNPNFWVFEADGYLDRNSLSEMCSVTTSPAHIRTIVDLNIRNRHVIH
jgi:hypothetical protein